MYHEIAIKTVDLNRTVFGIYRTTAFVTSHWGDNSRTVKIDTIQVTLSEEVLKAIDAVQAAIPDPAP
jgi:hypothetical protein